VLNGKVERKYGAIETDAAVLEWIRDVHGIGPDAPKAFEGDLMDWCDDVTHAVHDVMDFYRRESRGDHRRTSVAAPDPALREPSCRESGSSSPRVDHEMTFYRIRKTTTKELNPIRTSHSRSAGHEKTSRVEQR
jgi:hypothetical protein